MEGVFIRDHDVSVKFTTHILKKEEDEEIKENLYKVLHVLGWFKGMWALSRYPVMEKGKVVSPFERYDREDAQSAVEKAEFVFKVVSLILREKYGLKVAKEDTNQE